VREGNDNTLVILNIEGQDAVSRLDEILAVKSCDVIFVGLFDLSKAVGVPGEVEHPKVLKLLVQIVDQAKAAGKHVGTIATSLKKLEQFKAMGMTYIVYLVDCDVLRSAYSSAVRVFHGPPA
jgi:4-hydroxy-2-oxoheptanedioate aldolase